MEKKRYNKPVAVKLLESKLFESNGIKTTHEDKTANGLTKCIIDFIIHIKNSQAERINSTGIPYQDSEGNVQWKKGVSESGTSDIHATIKGKSVKIEIKIGLDKQSPAQIQYQKSIEKAGGIYYIAKDFTSFAWWYRKTFEK